MIVTISISTTALFLLNFKYAFFIGFTIGLVDALPALGSGFILWPWALYSILTSDYNFGIGLLITYIVIFITRQILEAKIFAKKSGIHPLLIIISMYIGLKVYGFFGFFIGPVVIILIKVMVFDDDYHL
jgi:predicted PurR-regulated permease PerM